MGRAVERTMDSPRHPTPRSPVPGPPIYLDARDKDLPYDGELKRPRGAETSYFDQPLGLREEGALLLAVLTGVQGSPLQRLAPGMPGFSLLYGVGNHGFSESPRPVKSSTNKGLKLELCMDAVAGLNANVAAKKQVLHKLERNADPVDECVDTIDLEEFTAENHEGGRKNWLFETAEEEEQYKYNQDLDAKAGEGREISLKDYIALVKKSAGRLGVRTQMLHDLSLGEDVDLGVTDLPAAPPPPPPPKPGANPDEKPKTAKDLMVGAMCATSLVVKKARRLAGLMHTEQQTLDLRDVCDWLQHLGTIAPPESTKTDAANADGSGGPGGKSGEQKGDWRLPSSPAMALLYAQEDLRQRLAHLYQEKNTLEKRKLQLTAAKRLVGKVGDAEEAKLVDYIHGLQTLEEGYETLGGKISDNLDDAQHLDKRFQALTDEAKENDKEKEGKGGKKGKKKGKKGKKGKKREGDDGEAKADASGASDSEGDFKSEGEGTDGEGKEKKQTKKAQAAEAVEKAIVTEHKATSPLPSSPTALEDETATKDQYSQTDDAALFSLMESMFNDMADEGPTGPEDEATELRRLRREVKKLKVQLRFWRSRNWIEQHGQNLLSSNSTTPSVTLPVDASPSEAGFAFYFDHLRHSIPGLDGTRGGHGSAPTNLTGSHGTGPGKSSGGGPSSAPSTLTHTRAHVPTPSPASQVDHVRSVPPAPLPAGLRLSTVETQRPSNPLNLRLMASAPPRGSRASRGWSVRPQDPPPVFPPNSLVIFGRSSTLQTPRESTPHARDPANIPQIGNMSPRRSGMGYQKA